MRKAVFESSKKKEVGVSDLTLISKISNEAINDNLKKRFENAEIYVRPSVVVLTSQPLGARNPRHSSIQHADRVDRHTSAMSWSPSTPSEIVSVARRLDIYWQKWARTG